METLPELGESEAFLVFQEQLSRAAPLDRSVLLVGERGSGKELAARSLHYLSPRWKRPLLSLNCATFHASLLEAELFGHVKGAFTGASEERKGLFEEADGSTLFLDEIALIPLAAQEKILRLVEYGEFRRLGSTRLTEVDVRLIGATNADLPSLVAAGRFKADLLDRLSFEVLYIPPLRLRSGDILLLAQHFALSCNQEFGFFDSVSFSKGAEQALLHHPWPGNIRELKNAVERSLYKSPGPVIDQLFLHPFQNPFPPPPDSLCPAHSTKKPSEEPVPMQPELGDYRATLQQTEQSFLRRALEQAQFKQGRAAELLGLSYDQFRSLYRKHKESL